MTLGVTQEELNAFWQQAPPVPGTIEVQTGWEFRGHRNALGDITFFAWVPVPVYPDANLDIVIYPPVCPEPIQLPTPTMTPTVEPVCPEDLPHDHPDRPAHLGPLEALATPIPLGSGTYIMGFSEYYGLSISRSPTTLHDHHAIDETDPGQGPLRNCRLFVTMCFLARTCPELLESNIVDNGDGTYTVHVYDDAGVRHPVVVRPLVPAIGAIDSEGSMVELSSWRPSIGDNELWPLLLEQAYALSQPGADPDAAEHDDRQALAEAYERMDENLGSIHATVADDVSATLGGSPTTTVRMARFRQDENIWSFHDRWARGEIVMASTYGHSEHTTDVQSRWIEWFLVSRHPNTGIVPVHDIHGTLIGELITNHAYHIESVNPTANTVVIVNPQYDVPAHRERIEMTWEQFTNLFIAIHTTPESDDSP